MKTLLVTSLCAIAALAMSAGDANASPNPRVSWATNGAGCRLETGSDAKAVVSASTGDISFASGQTGTIRVICPVSGLFANDAAGTSVNSLGIEYYDTDGRASACTVQGYLNRMNRGGTEGGGTITAYDNSTGTANTYVATSAPWRNAPGATVSHSFNFDTSFYYIEVVMNRSTTACNTALEGVSLSWAAAF